MAHTEYTPDKADAICEHIAHGGSLVKWCKENETGYSTVMQWLKAHKEFADNYTHAREHQADYLAEEIQDIADEINLETDEGAVVKLDATALARNRLRVDTRKWIASKMKPKKYGDRTIHAGDDENPIVMKTDGEIDARLAQLLGKAGITAADGGEGEAPNV